MFLNYSVQNLHQANEKFIVLTPYKCAVYVSGIKLVGKRDPHALWNRKLMFMILLQLLPVNRINWYMFSKNFCSFLCSMFITNQFREGVETIFKSRIITRADAKWHCRKPTFTPRPPHCIRACVVLFFYNLL